MELTISGIYEGSRRDVKVKTKPTLTIEMIRKAVAVVRDPNRSCIGFVGSELQAGAHKTR